MKEVNEIVKMCVDTKLGMLAFGKMWRSTRESDHSLWMHVAVRCRGDISTRVDSQIVMPVRSFSAL
jgi:hypothetical protein